VVKLEAVIMTIYQQFTSTCTKQNGGLTRTGPLDHLRRPHLNRQDMRCSYQALLLLALQMADSIPVEDTWLCNCLDLWGLSVRERCLNIGSRYQTVHTSIHKAAPLYKASMSFTGYNEAVLENTVYKKVQW